MTWLTWRQFRAQTIVAAAALALLASLLALTGPNLARLYHDYVASCHGAAACQAATLAFTNQVKATTID